MRLNMEGAFLVHPLAHMPCADPASRVRLRTPTLHATRPTPKAQHSLGLFHFPAVTRLPLRMNENTTKQKDQNHEAKKT